MELKLFQIKKKYNDDSLTIYFRGPIEETVDFETLIGPTPALVEINCKEISRINSSGVKAWIIYFQKCASQKIDFKFIECSSSIVEQFNLISNFDCGGLVESIYVPFYCVQCKKQLMKLFEVKKLRKMNFQLSHQSCSECQGPITFDDEPDEYFEYFQRPQR